MDITISEIQYLERTISKGMLNMYDSTWKKAFKLYNEHNEPNLGMSCRPCYLKVLTFLKSTNK